MKSHGGTARAALLWDGSSASLGTLQVLICTTEVYVRGYLLRLVCLFTERTSHRAASLPAGPVPSLHLRHSPQLQSQGLDLSQNSFPSFRHH